MPLNQPIVDAAPTPTGGGYWLLARDGAVFAYGDAAFLGAATTSVADTVAIVPTATGRGYWIAARDGGVFAFGDAPFLGAATDGDGPARGIVAMVARPQSDGYWLVAGDGAVLAFGAAVGHGTLPSMGLRVSVTAALGSPDGAGYWLLGRDGGVFSFGSAGFAGAAALGPGQVAVDLVRHGGSYRVVVERRGPPAAAAAPETGRRIVYANSLQRVWLFEADGTLVREYPVSGRRFSPAPGRYRVYSKSLVTTSAASRSTTMTHMVRFAIGARGNAIGFHAIPRSRGRPVQSEAELGSPRSLGCVRQADHDAAFLWDWAPVGTAVIVLP